MRRTARRTARRAAHVLTGTALTVITTAGFAAPAQGAGPDAGSRVSASAGTRAASLEVYPSTAVPGGQVSVNTAACGDGGAATGDAGAVGAGRFPLAPTAHEGESTGQFRVPPSAQPGTYEIVAECAAGGRRVTGDLVVVLASDRQPVHPRGSVKTGVGGALGPDPVQTAAGVAALAVAAAGGTWLLHRRARGDGI
ncbi:hypothetical protein OG613_16060 [Streptomyces sp. NBC_00015]|uniref:hypothetical protein n=1 Tax=unclassified Streptomyces TaxID=2593676 RepID=UPI0022560F7B|nr:hypothetical protein [Streptomyces sp. NBC_00103]MCX5370086.1 hypothetical protein [Streptomyces sp. NBC_00103]